jgi:adenylate kinase family enzyme
MRRVMIVGGPGSGKTTLAVELGRRTGLPVVHMDHIHWTPGWIERRAEEKDRLVWAAHRREAWILEGGHSRSYADRVAHADTLVWLDVPVGLRLWRVLRRAWTWRGRSRPDLPPGCPERLDRETLAFVRFILRSRRASRAKIAAIFADPPPHLRALRLRGRGAVPCALSELAPGPARAETPAAAPAPHG